MNKNIKYALLLSFLMSSFFGLSQNGEQLFDNSYLHEIRFDFDEPDYWNLLVTNYEHNSGDGSLVPYLMASVSVDGEIVDSVGVRFKGFTSYPFYSDKKPIKIDFNEFVPGKKYDGIRKLNLNNGTGDPSMQRDILCYEIMRRSGAKAPRTSFSKVYFNDVYWGVYQNIEQVDGEFLDVNFNNSKGNLYKNKGWSHLDWFGADEANYSPPFELKTNEENPDWSGFINFIDALNNTPNSEFDETISSVFDVDLYLKILAVDVATNNWDSYLEHGRNWYMYEDTSTNKFHWIPWDYNFSMDSNFFGGGGDCDIFANYFALSDGTTTVSFFDNSFYSAELNYYWDFGDGNNSFEKNPIHTYSSHGDYTVCLFILNEALCEDSFCFDVSTTFNPGDCMSIANGSSPHEANQVFQRVVEFVPACCDNWDQSCEDFYNDINRSNGGGGGGGHTGGGFSIDQSHNQGVLISRLLAVPDFHDTYYSLFCDLLNYHMAQEDLHALIEHNRTLIEDAVREDPNFLYPFPQFEADIGDAGVKEFLSARRNFLLEEINLDMSCQKADEIPFQDIVINELLASSSEASMIADPAGEFDDWYELYNNTSQDIDLSGVYISDSKTDLKKWKMPSGTTIGAEDYLIVWADNDLEQEGIHCNYKLNKAGDELTMSNADGTIIDSISFVEQTTDFALARVPNGTGDFIVQAPTHNGNNNTVSSTADPLDDTFYANIYPNPTSHFLNISIHDNLFTPDMKVNIMAITGQLIQTYKLGSASVQLDVDYLNSGMYIVQLEDENRSSVNQKFTVLK